ncbi:MAG: transposase [Anaerolineaceae bacterium]|nr:transposase [Anaerolineaceae bacterium]
MMNKKRKNYSPEEKARLLKEHLMNGVAVSQICEENQLQPTVFYRWQRQLFEQGAAAFKSDQDRERARLEKKIARLEEKVVRKNEVLGELMEAHIELKKSLGED